MTWMETMVMIDSDSFGIPFNYDVVFALTEHLVMGFPWLYEPKLHMIGIVCAPRL